VFSNEMFGTKTAGAKDTKTSDSPFSDFGDFDKGVTVPETKEEAFPDSA